MADIPSLAAPARLRALQTSGLLDTPPEEVFDRLTRLARATAGAPVALFSLLAPDRQFVKSASGSAGPWGGQRELPLSLSFCKHVVLSGAPLVIADLRNHVLIQEDPALTGSNLAAYLGQPVRAPDGEIVGTISVYDPQPHYWSADVVASVADLAAAATAEVAARIAGSTAEKPVPTDSFAVSDLTDHLEEGFYSIDLNWRITAVNRIAAQFLGKTREELLGRSIFEAYPRFAGSQVHAAHQRALSTNRPVRIESPAAGFESPLSIRIIPSPVGVAVFFHEISDLGRIREALRERDEALTLAEQSAGIGIWDSDPSTGLVRGTPQFFRLIGFEPSPEPVPIEIIRSVRHPEDQHRVLEGFRKAVESGAKTYDSEYRIIRRTDGELRWIFGRGLVTRDAAGKPIRYSGIDIDITERKKAEAALRESEERFRSLVQGVRDYAIFMLDGDGQVTTWNEGAALIFGYSAEEILGKPLGVFYPFERADQGWPGLEISRARTSGRTEDEGWRLRKDGSRFWANVVISALREESGRLKGFAAITRDLTKAREAEEALRSSEERLRLCQEAAEIGIWDWDIALGEIGWSERNFALHGMNPESDGPSYAQWQNAIHPADRDRVNAGIAQAIATGAPYQADYRVVYRSGETRWLAVRGRVMTDEYGRPIRMLGVTLDITDRRNAAEALSRLNNELEQRVAERTAAFEEEAAKRAEVEARLRQSQKMEALGQLTGGVAHDFNNLLTVILGSLETMQRRISDAPEEKDGTAVSKVMRPIAMALQATQSAAQLTHRLLAFSRQQPLQPKVLQINDLIAGMTEMIARTLSEAVQLETHLAPDLWLAFADANQLEIALLNLVVNSRDAMPEGGRLTIETANAQFSEHSGPAQDIAAGEYAMLAVTDTGTGMTREVMDRAIDPFFTTKGPGKGSGLGLSMAYGFVKQSGGHIRLYSEPGHGTSVKIYLPRSREAPDATSTGRDRARPSSRALPRARQGETILVVEDNADVRGYSVSTLLDLGYLIREAGTGPEALRLLAEEPEMRLDLLFTDVILPDGMNGRQLADRLLKLRPALPILFTTGYTRNAIVKHGRLDPDINLIAKPFNIDQLARKIRQLLDGRDG